jgi:hypothetical protein
VSYGRNMASGRGDRWSSADGSTHSRNSSARYSRIPESSPGLHAPPSARSQTGECHRTSVTTPPGAEAPRHADGDRRADGLASNFLNRHCSELEPVWHGSRGAAGAQPAVAMHSPTTIGHPTVDTDAPHRAPKGRHGGRLAAMVARARIR